jgi:hypothetical protein
MEMQSLWETQKFRVKPHACDRDYQHLSGLRGCAPSFSLSPGRRGSLGYIDMVTAKRAMPSITKSTYAQTVARDGYSVVGMGRPALDAAFARSTGFLSMQQKVFTEAAEVGVDGKSIFVPCKTLDQCFVDIFHYNGQMRER